MTENITSIKCDIYFYNSLTPLHPTNFDSANYDIAPPPPAKQLTDFVCLKFTCLPLKAFRFDT